MTYLPVPRDLTRKAFEWFRDREPLIWAAKNRPELETRLTWLSEGSLVYHLCKHTTTPPPCPKELDLFARFLASNPPRLAKRKKSLPCQNQRSSRSPSP